jgi:hypothetical protein
MNWEWIAGFYEGEGSVSYAGTKDRHSLSLCIVQTERTILSSILKFVGFGRIHPRTRAKLHHKRQWVLVFNGAKAHRFANMLLPYLKMTRRVKQLQRYMRSCPPPKKLYREYQTKSTTSRM